MLHKNVIPGDNHILYNWVVADSTALAALTSGLTDADEGKVAFQTDTSAILVLLDHVTPTWLPMSVTSVTGSALTGLSLASVAAVVAADSILVAIGKLQARSTKYAVESICIAASDELTALTAGTGKITFRMPYAFTLTSVKASLTTAQTSGSIFTVDINEAGATILSTKLTIDNTEKTTVTAATPAVISDTSLAADAEMTIDIDQIGDGTAKGLKIYLIGTQT